jgi:hypothetical protein
MALPKKKRPRQTPALPPQADGTSHPNVLAITGIVVVTWISHYWLSGDFGLYEDDYYWPVVAMEMSVPDFFRSIWKILTNLNENMARPILDTLMFGLSMVGYGIGKLQGMYFVSFLVVSLNAVLMYLLGWKLTSRQVFGFAAAIAYTLYPADTTQAYIMHSFGLQPSLTFLLLALILWVGGKRTAAYAVAALCLLTYEVAYPVFFAAPLLTEVWSRRLPATLLRHGAIAGGVLAAVLAARMLIGENRISGLDVDSAVPHILYNISYGPIVALREWGTRPLSGFQYVSEYAVPLVVTAAGLLAILFMLLRIDRGDGTVPTPLLRLGQLAVAALGLLPVAYLLTLTVNSAVLNGRGSRVHMAAVVGCSLFVACVVTFLYDLAQRRRLGIPVLLLVAVIFLGAMGDRFRIQESYRSAWLAQRGLWTDILELCPDAGDNTVILIDRNGIKNPREAMVLGWNTMGVPAQLMEMSGWKLPPIAAPLRSDWKSRLERGIPFRRCIDWLGLDWAYQDRNPNADYILLELHRRELRRVEGEVEIGGVVLRFKERAAEVLPTLGRRPLHDVLILGTGGSASSYVR